MQTATDKIDHPVVSRGNSCKRLAIVTEMGSFRRHARFMTINPGDSPQKFLSIIHPCAINPNDRDGCTAGGAPFETLLIATRKLLWTGWTHTNSLFGRYYLSQLFGIMQNARLQAASRPETWLSTVFRPVVVVRSN